MAVKRKKTARRKTTRKVAKRRTVRKKTTRKKTTRRKTTARRKTAKKRKPTRRMSKRRKVTRKKKGLLARIIKALTPKKRRTRKKAVKRKVVRRRKVSARGRRKQIAILVGILAGASGSVMLQSRARNGGASKSPLKPKAKVVKVSPKKYPAVKLLSRAAMVAKKGQLKVTNSTKFDITVVENGSVVDIASGQTGYIMRGQDNEVSIRTSNRRRGKIFDIEHSVRSITVFRDDEDHKLKLK